MTRTHTQFIVLILFVASCQSDDKIEVNLTPDSFSYIETESFSDYNGDSRLKIYDPLTNSNILVATNNGFIQYEWRGLELYYLLDRSVILKYDPTNNESITLVDTSPDLINGFSISPDKETLAYSNGKDVVLLDLNTRTSLNITTGMEGDFGSPIWSQNGSSLLLRNSILKTQVGDDAPTVTSNFKVYSLGGKDFTNIEMFHEFAYPSAVALSPSGNIIAYSQYGAIFTFDLSSMALSRITSDDIRASRPTFSSNGEKIGYLATGNSQTLNEEERSLIMYNISSKSHQPINGIKTYSIAWNNDSETVLYLNNDGINLFDFNVNSTQLIIEQKPSSYFHSIQFVK